MKAKDFDAKFDEDIEDVIDDIDVTTARRVNQEPKPSHEAANKKTARRYCKPDQPVMPIAKLTVW